ncbi:hypothetical protein PCC7424_4228 [Gloeothece citriformis PCC 7424]|uniref:Uncharacterized protein n=1 Tax=Gloeothece citriformis (strain PCC 7424) TaxID=65393 RepID=B7KLM6_GLOC7|nr:hypothetical protein [Gloeothece citriformis]ACK72598.1 hypothetical protein PCC7424_4228 [Gloeothece citriformis PCC 7424]
MLHLAQVCKNPISGEVELQLLAHKTSDQSWEVSNISSVTYPLNNQEFSTEGLLVLVELTETQKILKIELAKDWILSLIEKYLIANTITPEWVEQEQERVEQWRQEITAKSLDLNRRHLEIETRRDQLQELEISLKQEKEKLDSRWQQLQQLQNDIQKEKDDLKACHQTNLDKG